MGNIQTLQDLIGMLRRRWLLMLPIVLAGMAVSLWVALGQPRVYESVAVIQIDALTTAGAPGDPAAAQRLQLIEQRLFQRENLLALIDRHGLFRDGAPLSPNEQVAALRQAVTLQSIAPTTPGPTQGVSALLITARLGDPVLAAAVANDLAEQVLRLNSSREAERIRETLEFYRAEEGRISAEIATLEADLTRYKNENLQALPSAAASLREESMRLDDDLRALDQRVLELTGQRSALEGERPLRAVIQRQIDTLTAQIAVIDDQRMMIRNRQGEIAAILAGVPAVETMLGSYDRRLDQLREQFAVVTRRLAEAETSQRLDASEQGLRFVMLERAVEPDYPLSSGRRKTAVFGTAASLALALAAALALELRNPVLRTAGQLERAVGIVPVVSIPYVQTPGERRRQRALRTTGLALLGAVVLVLALMVGASYGLV